MIYNMIYIYYKLYDCLCACVGDKTRIIPYEIHAVYRSLFVVGSHACSKDFCLVSLVVPHLDPESEGHRFVPYKTVEHFTC